MFKFKQKPQVGRPAKNSLTIYNMKGRDKLKRQILDYMDYCDGIRRMSGQTMDYKKWCFNEFVRNTSVKSLEDLTDADMKRWISRATKKQKLSPVTINHLISQMMVFLKYSRDMGINFKVHISMLERQPEPDQDKVMSFKRDDIIKVLSYADLREWLQIALMFDCGLRINELRHLRLDNLHGRGMNIIGKGGRMRFVMMSEETYKKLQFYIERENITDWIFPGRDKVQPLSKNQIRRNTAKVFIGAGYSNYHPHMLRHSFAMDLHKERNASVREVQQFLGHAKIVTTEVYLDKMTKEEQAEFWEEKRFGKDYTLSN